MRDFPCAIEWGFVHVAHTLVEALGEVLIIVDAAALALDEVAAECGVDDTPSP